MAGQQPDLARSVCVMHVPVLLVRVPRRWRRRRAQG